MCNAALHNWYDPLNKFISASLSPLQHSLLPCCDDLAIAIINVVSGWQIILECFEVIYKVASLLLNTDKAQFPLTSHTTKDHNICSMLDTGHIVSREQFLS